MNPTTKKFLTSIFVIIALSVGLVLTGMGNDSKTEGPIAGTNQALSESSDKGTADDNINLAMTESLTGSLVKLVLALGVVVAAIYGFLFILKKMMGKKFTGNNSQTLIEVIETAHIAQKRSVSVIRFHDRAVLVGICEGSIQRLAELGPEETSAILLEKNAEHPSGSFAGALQDARTRFKSWNVARLITKGKERDLKSPQAA